jgi:hypothetical protein
VGRYPGPMPDNRPHGAQTVSRDVAHDDVAARGFARSRELGLTDGPELPCARADRPEAMRARHGERPSGGAYGTA